MAAKNILVIVTVLIFAVFFSNVVAGASGAGAFLSDVFEMLTLLAACICFVVAMLAHERAAAATKASPAKDNNE